MLGLLWLLAGSFLLGAIVSLAIAAYVGVHLLSRAEESQIRSRHAAAERSREYSEAVERGDVPFEPPPSDAQINGDHAELRRQAAQYTPGANAPRTRPPTMPLAAADPSSPSTPHADIDGEHEDGEEEGGSGQVGGMGGCLVAGWISLQMAGKRKTRKACYAFVRDTDLYHGPREGDALDEYEVIGLDGCLVRTMDDEKNKLTYAVEISHTNRKVAGKSDYIYLITQSETVQLRWYHALLKICEPYESIAEKPQSRSGPLEAATSLMSRKERMKSAFQELRGYKPTVTTEGTHGWVRIQREDDPKQVQKRFATAKSLVFATYNTEKIFAANERWEVDLRGCTAELVQRPKNAVKLSRKASELTAGLDHIYVIADTAEYATLWHSALSAGARYTSGSLEGSAATPVVSPRSMPSLPSSSSGSTSAPAASLSSSSIPSTPSEPVVGATATNAASEGTASGQSAAGSAAAGESAAEETANEFLKIESAEWINALTSRFWYNFRNSEELVVVIKTFLETKMKAKLAEKKLAGFLERIDVVDLSLGDFVPKMSGIKILPQRRSGELGIDLVLDYRGEDRPAFVKFTGNVWVTQKTCIPFCITATLHSLTGKMHLHCAPWPAERFSVSFYSVPVMDIRLESVVGGDKRQIRNFPKLNNLILNKLTNILIEKTVMPNRRYITIPRTKKRTTGAVPEATASSDAKEPTAPGSPPVVEDRRKAVVQSILDSERSFIDSLQPFIKLYSEDMFLELTELHEMFGRVMVLYNYHHKIVKDLEAKLEKWDGLPPLERTVVQIFLQLTEFVAIEMEFSSRVESYVATIARLRQSNRRFGAYLNDRDASGEDDLSEILRKPALRSFLYAALLKELLGCTSADHPDRKALERITTMLLPLADSAAHGNGDSATGGAGHKPSGKEPMLKKGGEVSASAPVLPARPRQLSSAPAPVPVVEVGKAAADRHKPLPRPSNPLPPPPAASSASSAGASSSAAAPSAALPAPPPTSDTASSGPSPRSSGPLPPLPQQPAAHFPQHPVLQQAPPVQLFSQPLPVALHHDDDDDNDDKEGVAFPDLPPAPAPARPPPVPARPSKPEAAPSSDPFPVLAGAPPPAVPPRPVSGAFPASGGPRSSDTL